MRKSRFTKARIIGMIKQQEFEDGRMPIDNNLLGRKLINGVELAAIA